MESNDVLGLLLGFLSDVATVFQPLAEGIANFTKTVCRLLCLACQAKVLLFHISIDCRTAYRVQTALEARAFCLISCLHAIMPYSSLRVEVCQKLDPPSSVTVLVKFAMPSASGGKTVATSLRNPKSNPSTSFDSILVCSSSVY